MSLGLIEGGSFDFICLCRGIERLANKKVTKKLTEIMTHGVFSEYTQLKYST